MLALPLPCRVRHEGKKMFHEEYMLKFVSLIFCIALLSQCTPVVTSSQSMETPIENKLTKIDPYAKSASMYLALAEQQTGIEQQSLLIKAAGRLIRDGQWKDACAILSQTHALSDKLASEKALLLAKADLIRQQPHRALATLTSVNIKSLSPYYQTQFYETLAKADAAEGNPVGSVSARLKLDNLLSDKTTKERNSRAIWRTLTTLATAELHRIATAPHSKTFDGWIKLALISRQHHKEPQKLSAEVEQWQLHFPQHPGQLILSSPLSDVASYSLRKPKEVALLLPLTGPLAGPGHAVKDGFMAHSISKKENIRFYDTAMTEDIETLYQEAIHDGAEFVVGPLDKIKVAKLASIEHPVPTLLLNDTDTPPTAGAFQFGLSPTNEAQQTAIKAYMNGYRRALIIAPAGNWGDDVIKAFTQQWNARGARIIDTWHYAPTENMDESLRNFLQISASEERIKELKQLIGQNIESLPNRRQDFDMIFLLAYPSKARQIMPMLNYYYAGDIPVYATSAVYSGEANANKDRDLNGIIFCDMPWVFSQQMGSKNWPEQYNSYNRLYALGADSHSLLMKLPPLLLFSAINTDKNGVLHLKASQQIARFLNWGQFKNGLVERFEYSYS